MLSSKRTWSELALLAIAVPAFGGLTAPRSLLDLEQSADLIVVGAITGPVLANPVTNFTIQIDRAVKGDTTLSGSTIAVSWPNGSPSSVVLGSTINVSGTGLWFLQHSAPGWVLMPIFVGDVPFESTFIPVPATPILAAYAYDSTASLADKVASEISSAIESAGGAYSLQLYALQRGLLDQLQSPVVTLLYQRLSNSTSTQQRILGLSGLVRGGNATALTAAGQLAPNLSSYPPESGILISSVRDYYRSTDSTSVVAVGQAASDSADSNSAFRVAAAHALAAIHTAATLPYMAALLDDPDTQLQIEGIRGIGAFANGLPTETLAGVPSLSHMQLTAGAPYRTDDTIRNFALGSDVIASNEASYLQFWKQWWVSNRSGLGY
jgi:hypothetical protein